MSMTPEGSPHPPPAPREGSPDPTALPQVQYPDGETFQQSAARRSSFNFLRRKSSGDNRSQRSASGAKMSKKQKALAQEEALRKQREAAMLPKQPPRLPSQSPFPQIETFGGEDTRPDSIAIISNKAHNYKHNFSRPSGEYKMAPAAGSAPPPLPGGSLAYTDFDPYPRTESMTHRGRYSYASSAISTVNSPRRVRRRKDPTPFK
jgi:hypothetical protein